ncbi:HAD-superfamily hydrolase, subfamily IA, variant 3 [Parafrankia sp. EUN1f]|nr:HAD-superfamily hydrolase, subfamily IA, variant 3 [Parafrankia sp. EUN1f]
MTCQGAADPSAALPVSRECRTLRLRSVGTAPAASVRPAPTGLAPTGMEESALTPPTQPPSAVVFDCDGTLVDSEICWHRAYTTLFGHHDRVFTPDHHDTLIGQPLPVVGRVLTTALGVPDHHGSRLIGDILDLVTAELAAGAPARLGAVHLVRELAALGYPLAVASSAPRDLVHQHLAGAGLTDAFTAVLGGEDADQPKPHPDIYLRACAALGATPARSIAIEDSPPGVDAARAAGMYVIGVPGRPQLVLASHLTVRDLTAPHLRRVLGLPPAAPTARRAAPTAPPTSVAGEHRAAH